MSTPWLDPRFEVRTTASGATVLELRPAGAAAAAATASGKQQQQQGKKNAGKQQQGKKNAGKGKGKGKGNAKAASPAPAATGGAGAGAGAGAGVNTSRRDHLLSIEKKVQEQWAAAKIFEANPPKAGEEEQEKFFVTFPYPYMNGRLHLGHAFSFSKSEFAAGFQRMLGKRVLMPFGFHCTGMPIQAAANSLKRELAEAAAEAAAAEAGEVKAEEVVVEAADASTATATKQVNTSGRFRGARTKLKAKTGSGMSQFDIMAKMGIPEEEVPAFQDPTHWLEYFPPFAKTDLEIFGSHIDWRRSFITTAYNPYYDSFIRWQFNTLKEKKKIDFGTRPTIYSPVDGQACADHDRKKGEGVVPQEYSLIKLRVQAAGLSGVLENLAGRDVFLVAATLRPETMYGQTNCFVLPAGSYGAFEMGNGEVFICSLRSARNMSYQGMTAEEGVAPQLGRYKGSDLIGLPLSAPNAVYETVYTLPLLTIDMKKGTGVVTSVPSDAPDDYAALRDLQNDAKLRAKYGVKEEWVKPFEVVEILEIPGISRQSAVTVCKQLKIKSQKDKAKLEEAKARVYLKGFYDGIMLVGSQAGKKVIDAKPLVRAEMIAANQAAIYWEPEKLVVSRTNDECVVAHLDQWYLKYGNDEWREQVLAHVRSEHFSAFSPMVMSFFERALDWLKEWACSRWFGLGTQLPWDPQFVIESLSDSTLYFAYYTICHYLHADIFGKEAGIGNIDAKDLTDEVWNYIFLEKPYPEGSAVPKETLDAMKREFEYWYPMDLRCSGKDLIQNHLIMSLYNHAAVWDGRTDRMPQAFFANGHVLVNGSKMSKSLGNFLTLTECIDQYSADATRFALANAGDTLDDPNFETQIADQAVLRLTKEEDWCKRVMGLAPDRTTEYEEKIDGLAETILETRMNVAIVETRAHYEGMRFRDGLKTGYFDLQIAGDEYKDLCVKSKKPQSRSLLKRFVEVQTLLLAPICPHYAENIWQNVLGNKTSVVNARWPEAGPIDELVLARADVLRETVTRMRHTLNKARATGEVTKMYVYVADSYPDWQETVMGVIKTHADAGTLDKKVLKGFSAIVKKDKNLCRRAKQVMAFAAEKFKEVQAKGPSAAALTKLPFDEAQLMIERDEFLRTTLELPADSITVFRTSDESMYDPKNRAQNSKPGRPTLFIE